MRRNAAVLRVWPSDRIGSRPPTAKSPCMIPDYTCILILQRRSPLNVSSKPQALSPVPINIGPIPKQEARLGEPAAQEMSFPMPAGTSCTVL